MLNCGLKKGGKRLGGVSETGFKQGISPVADESELRDGIIYAAPEAWARCHREHKSPNIFRDAEIARGGTGHRQEQYR